MNELPRKSVAAATLYVGGAGGAQVGVHDENGEVLASVFFRDGARPMRDLVALVPEGGGLSVAPADGFFFVPGGKHQKIGNPMARHSGANPNFRPRSQYDPTLRMDKLLGDLERRNKALEKREKAMNAAAAEERARAKAKEDAAAAEAAKREAEAAAAAAEQEAAAAGE